MATVVAGLKRSHHEMIGETLRAPYTAVYRASRTQSPFERPSRASSQPLDIKNGDRTEPLNPFPRQVSFSRLASIVLVGVRGVGKSTLGILAATAYSRRLVDSERAFFEDTGETASAYRKARGIADYRRRHSQVLETTLNDNSTGAIIVCSFSDLEGNGAEILRKYAQSHPVIHVTRDVEGIRSVLRVWSVERIHNLLSTSAPLLRSCSNYEFFNLTEWKNQDDHRHVDHNENTAARDNFLTLKRVERDFLRLLRNTIGEHERSLAHHSAYPFSQVGIERRSYTFAVTVHVSEVLRDVFDLEDAQIGADCIELLVSPVFTSKRQYLNDISKAFAIVRRATILPIMLSVDNTETSQLRGFKFETLVFFLSLGPELMTADLSLSYDQLLHLVKSKGVSKIVGWSQMSNRPSEGWFDQHCIDTYTRGALIGCDFVKITMPAGAVEDCFAVPTFHSRVKALDKNATLIAYNLGSKGKTSKCFNKTLTSVRPHRATSEEEQGGGSTNDVSAKEVTQGLFAAFVFEPMRCFIFGGDVSYSLSPAMHNAAYEACGMRYIYETVSSDDIDLLKREATRLDFGGAAVVQPYKTVALELMDALSPHAKAIGAVNTVVPIREMASNGSVPSELEILSRQSRRGPVKALYGYNTDWIGIRACIRRGLSPANTIRPHSTALVCGAGGMARAAVYSLISLGVRSIFLCNRTRTRALALAEHYNGLIAANELSVLSSDHGSETRVHVVDSFASDWPIEARSPAIIVCCIPRRTEDDMPTDFTLPEAWLRSPTGGVVLEVAYRQPASPVEHQMKARASAGWIFMDGYDVLPEQAFSQFELFAGRRAPRKLMRDEIDRYAHL